MHWFARLSTSLPVGPWAALVVYAGFLAFQMADVLEGRYALQGLNRAYKSPYFLDDYWIYDPRPDSLEAELKARYGVDIALDPGSDALHWQLALDRAEIPFGPCDEHSQDDPKLLFSLKNWSTPVLQIKGNEHQAQIFFPGVGVAVSKPPLHKACIALHVQHVPPW